MADLSTVDIRACVDHLRPDEAWRWKGDGQYGNQYDAVGGQTDDPDAKDYWPEKPTEAEILKAWETLQAKMTPAGQATETARQKSESFDWRVFARVLARLGLVKDVRAVRRAFKEECEKELNGK